MLADLLTLGAAGARIVASNSALQTQEEPYFTSEPASLA
jgi:hypothetical protein